MSATRELVDALIAGGMHAAEAAALLARAAVEMSVSGPSKAALRTRKWRAGQASQTVTGDDSVTVDESVTERHKPSQNVTGDDASLSKKERIEERKEVRGPRIARASQLPADWHPGENAWQAAVARIGQPRAVAELQKFKNHAADKGRVSKSWDAAWRNWVDRALDYGGGMGTKGNSNGRRTVHDAANDLLATLQAFDEPAPDLRSIEGETAIRLLPSR